MGLPPQALLISLSRQLPADDSVTVECLGTPGCSTSPGQCDWQLNSSAGLGTVLKTGYSRKPTANIGDVDNSRAARGKLCFSLHKNQRNEKNNKIW